MGTLLTFLAVGLVTLIAAGVVISVLGALLGLSVLLGLLEGVGQLPVLLLQHLVDPEQVSGLTRHHLLRALPFGHVAGHDQDPAALTVQAAAALHRQRPALSGHDNRLEVVDPFAGSGTLARLPEVPPVRLGHQVGRTEAAGFLSTRAERASHRINSSG